MCLVIACLFLITQQVAYSQDTTYATSTAGTGGTIGSAWYLQPWAWIAGGAILLVILISVITTGKKKTGPVSRTDRVIITKTVTTETDIED